MKKIFYIGVIGLLLFELANVYFIMPMPGSQQMNSIDLAYFLHQWRWAFRAIFGVLIVLGAQAAFQGSKILSIAAALVLLVVIYQANFVMAADAMFLQPEKLTMRQVSDNQVDTGRLVLGIEHQGEAKAYPIEYLGYHHQVVDTIAGKPVIVTYCTVCRTGRAFEPIVNGKVEQFRLVGMDHFNAMFEDKSTKSWWRQVTGEAIAGKLKGQVLPELSSTQMSLQQWVNLYPNTWIMQPDTTFHEEYDSTYEVGRLTGMLTRRDTLSWQDKSWVVGVSFGQESKAYDWNNLEQERIIYDILDNKPIAIILAPDNKSFVALQRQNELQQFAWRNDTLYDQQHGNGYNLMGKSYDSSVPDLKKINAYQEYWHSWRTFHPATKRDD